MIFWRRSLFNDLLYFLRKQLISRNIKQCNYTVPEIVRNTLFFQIKNWTLNYTTNRVRNQYHITTRASLKWKSYEGFIVQICSEKLHSFYWEVQSRERSMRFRNRMCLLNRTSHWNHCNFSEDLNSLKPSQICHFKEARVLMMVSNSIPGLL